MTRYCMDTSVLIDAVKLYPKDVFSRLWATLEEWGRAGRVLSPDEVMRELAASEDEASAWATENKHIFRPPLEGVQVAAKEVLARYPELVPEDASRAYADPWVVAQARVDEATVVSSEKLARPGGRAKIPDVCAAFDIPCMKLLDMFRVMDLGY
jgi:hypothetical protein